MSLSAALNSAMSGLHSNSRVAELISENIANALTPGYAKREIVLQSNGDLAPGVRVSGVRDLSDPAMVAFRREAETDLENASERLRFLQRIEGRTGILGSGDALSDLLNNLETALVTARSNPESESRLSAVVASASDVAVRVNSVSEALSKERSDADARIASAVKQLNTSLEEIQNLNTQITQSLSRSVDTSGLKLRRQTLVDGINNLISVQQVEREHGKIALYTKAGSILLDGPPVEISFSPTSRVEADMSLENGDLSSITFGGSTASPEYLGGEIGALFEIRDILGPDLISALDLIASDLVEMMVVKQPDASSTTDGFPLFVFGVGRVEGSVISGGSAHIRVNPSLTERDEGGLWQLRDGLEGGEPGDATRLDWLLTRLTENRGAGGRTLVSSVEEFSSKVGADRLWSEDQQTRHSARLEHARASEAQVGVNTDEELQHLLEIEKAYAANARVIETINALFDDLLRI